MDIFLTVLAVFIIICLWIVIFDMSRFVVRKYTFEDAKIKKSCKAVVIADLHSKRYGRDNKILLEAIDDCHPDFILIAGDIPTAKKGKKLDVAISFVTELAKKYPIFYGNGNHEHRMDLYPETYGTMGEEYEEALLKIGVKRLVNEKKVLEENGICITGSQIDRFYFKRFRTMPMAENYMTNLLGKPDETLFQILIAHNPDYFPYYAGWGADLVLSGHVHGGLVRIPIIGKGVLSPQIRFFPKYDGGLFQEKNSTMIVSRGLGEHTIPVRFFNPGELILIDFIPKD